MADTFEQFDQIPTAQKVAMVLLLGAGIFFAFFFLAYQPLEKSVAQQEAALAAVEASIENLSQTEAQVDTLREELTRLCTQRELIARQLPPEPFGPQLRARLETLANQTDVSLISIEPGDANAFMEDEPTQGLYSMLRFGMSITGNYEQLTEFFYQLGREDRIISVSHLHLGSNGASFRLVAYYAGTDSAEGDLACASLEDSI